MTFVRLSLMKPSPGNEDEVERINRDLVAHYLGMKGCLAGYLLKEAGGGAEICRLTLWESEADAGRAANDHHTLSSRSTLHRLIQPGDVGRSFVVI